MKTISKKAFIYIIVGLLTFSSVSFVYYRSVHAMEWVGGALAFEEALKWTLAVLGITATAGMTDAYWDEYGDDFVNYAIQDGATQTEVAEWQLKLCEGVLDKASSCWTSFKSWASSLSKNIGGTNNNPTLTAYSIDTFLYAVNTYYGTTFTADSSWQGHYVYSAFFSRYFGRYNIRLFVTDNPIEFQLIGSNNQGYLLNRGSTSATYKYSVDLTGNETLSYSNITNLDNSYNLGQYGNELDISLFNITPIDNAVNNINVKNFNISGELVPPAVTDSNLNAIENDVTNLDVIDSDLPDESSNEVSIPMPGLGTSDNTASSDAYDDIINAINNGDIPIEKGIEDIQSLLKVIAYDTDTDDVFPNRPNPADPNENVKKDDVIKANRDNMGFTLFGLENVFPFCIPWDIYAFISILEAEPVAPKFSFPFYNPTTKEYVDYEIDLSPWNDVASVIRYGADFTFIVGLALATRRLIGAGGGD